MDDIQEIRQRMEEASVGFYSKYVGVAKIVDPASVTSELSSRGNPYVNGAIFCSCPELGFEGDNLLYCRYGLSIPYYKVKLEDRLWIQPTIGPTERWIYTGFVDCGRASVDPTVTDTQGIIETESGIFTITVGTCIIKLDSVAGKVSINGTNLEVEV